MPRRHLRTKIIKKRKLNIWKKAKSIKGKNPKLYRQDPYGKEMYYPSYGKYSDKGWQIDHIKPKSRGGSDYLKNLQALNSRTNVKKSNTLVKKSRHLHK